MKNLFLIMVWNIIGIPTIIASNYYVSVSGNDANTGTFSNPWQTIQHGLDIAQVGDTVFVRGGEYNEQAFSQRSGTSGNMIVLYGYQNEQVILDGTGVTAGNNGLNINFSLVNIEVRDWNDTGVWISGNISNIVVKNCKVHDCLYCLSLSDGVHDFVVDNTVTYNFGPVSGGGDGFGFSCEPNGVPCYNGLITNCKSYHGRDITANNDGFALGHYDVSNITFRNCETYDVFDGFDMSGHNILLDRCSAHDITNGDGGYKLWPDSITLINCIGYNANSNVQLDYDGRTATANLFNCTFHGAIAGGYNIWIENPTTSHLNMYNCIVSGGDNIGLMFEGNSISNYSGDYNIFQNDDTARVISSSLIDLSPAQIQSGSWTSLSGQDANSIALVGSLTLFWNDGASPNLNLRAGSEAVNNGLSTYAPSIDYEGRVRNDGFPDIGAYEYDTLYNAVTILLQTTQKNFLVYPNPTSDYIVIKLPEQVNGLKYNIFDQLGRQVLSGNLHNETTIIDIQELAIGVYWVQIGGWSEKCFKL